MTRTSLAAAFACALTLAVRVHFAVPFQITCKGTAVSGSVRRPSLCGHCWGARTAKRRTIVALTSTSAAESAELAGRSLKEALRSLSGKLTISAEIVIPEPSDPTAILLQSTELQKLSSKIRLDAKANSAWISASSVDSLRTFTSEQESARGDFPGPVPVVYCPTSSLAGESLDLAELASAGAYGVVTPVMDGAAVTAPSDIASGAEALAKACAAAIENGLQPVPEITVAQNSEWTEDSVVELVDSIKTAIGFDPVAVLLSMDAAAAAGEDGADGSVVPSFPPVPKSLARGEIPVLCSVRAVAGEDGLLEAFFAAKDAGYTGAVLRSECVPGYRLNPDLNDVARFWSATISDLKSTKSRKFSFRATMEKLETTAPQEWLNYQTTLMESGVVGGESGAGDAGGGEELDTERGDYKGF